MSSTLPKAIPSPNRIADRGTREVLDALKACVESLYGVVGNSAQAALLVGEAIRLGLVRRTSGGALAAPSAASSSTGQAAETTAPGSPLTALRLVLNATSGLGVGVYNLGEIPAGCRIVRSWYEVLTEPDSGTDTATIEVGIEDDANAIKAAQVVTHAQWAAGLHEGLQDGTVANFSAKTTTNQNVIATIAVENLTAGKIVFHVQYAQV